MVLASALLLGAPASHAQQVPLADGVYLVAPESDERAVRVEYWGEATASALIRPEALMSLGDVSMARADIDRTGLPVVRVWLSEAGRRRFGEITRAHVGDRLAVVIDGAIVTAPRINEPIEGGELQISGGFDNEEAAALAARLSPER